MKEKSIPNNQRGAILVTFAILLTVLIGFAAVGIDLGRCYLAKAKLKEAADAAALAGVQAYGFTDWDELSTSVANENFHAGYLGCSLSNINIIAPPGSNPVTVDANLTADCNTSFARIFGIDTVTVSASSTGNPSTAERMPVEIMLVLDRSGSMGMGYFGQVALDSLKDAAKSFVKHFEYTQHVDKMGVITFSTGVTVPFQLQHNFIDNGIEQIIDDIECGIPHGDYATNMEDALDQADDDQDRGGNSITTFTQYPQGTPQNQRVKQFLIFFTDGANPDSFRGDFTRNGQLYDGVIPGLGSSWGAHQDWVDICDYGYYDPYLPYNMGWLHDPWTGLPIKIPPGIPGIDFIPTGDGLPKATTTCKWDCDGTDAPYETTKWHMFDPVYNDEYGGYEDDYSIGGGYSSPYCNVSREDLEREPVNYVVNTSKQMARYHARMLKQKDIIIYCIGFWPIPGSWFGEDLLRDISSYDPARPGEEYYYYGADGSGLASAFNHVAMEMKRYVYLVQ